MYPSIENYALLRSLDNRPDLRAKVLELRSDVAKYLGAVSSTFAHYTSHAVDHSDQIVREMSSFLFQDPADPSTAVLELSSTEVYLLLLSAYLHDTGMVVTDQEKLDALGSTAWIEFSNSHKQAADIVEVDNTGLTTDQERFVRGLEQQWALSEFFRRQHADRAAVAINSALNIQRFLNSDPAAERTLIAVCVGHGVTRHALKSDTEYPTRRDLFGEPVNVRLLTVLLRIGDLLDLRHERSCPLLRSAVSPLPRSSQVHWSQYERISHRVTSPAEFGIHASCETAEEHRLLLDWCTWLASEVEGAHGLIASEPRHAGWTTPLATVGDQGTIRIARASGAKYRVEDWKFFFDEEAVVTRLVRDVHGGGLGWIRELVQNALDATRVKLYTDHDLTERYPNEVATALRSAYPLVIDVQSRAVDPDIVDSIAVIDVGIGMTTDTIKNYFLQIGRSWYTSNSFVGRFAFTPTSRFGVGFLSVFAASDDVQVVTRWHLDPPEDAVSMRLSGPRGYLLIEDAERQTPGTSVTVKLRERLATRTMVELITKMCRAVEFPIQLLVDGHQIEVRPESDARLPAPIPLAEDTSCRLRRIDASGDGVYGFVEFMVLESGGVEDWSLSQSRLERKILEIDAMATIPSVGRSVVSVNGLVGDFSVQGIAASAVRHVLDFRTADAVGGGGLDRLSIRELPGSVVQSVAEALTSHMDNRGNDAAYAAGLVAKFDDLCPDWAAAMPYIETVSGILISIHDLLKSERVLVPHQPVSYLLGRDKNVVAAVETTAAAEGIADRTISLSSERRLTSGHRTALLDGEWTRVIEPSASVALVEVVPSKRVMTGGVREPHFAPDSEIVSLKPMYGRFAMNSTHPLMVDINSLKAEHPLAHKRLVESLNDTYSLLGSDLAARLQGVAAALTLPRLEAWARTLEIKSSPRSPDILRVPRTPVANS